MKNKYILIPLAFLALIFLSCKTQVEEVVIDAPQNIREGALNFAHFYCSRDTEYELGGQDSLRSVVTPPSPLPINKDVIKIDCSGFVVMCYKYALVDTPYHFLQNDMAVSNIYSSFSTPISSPSPGDLIFMGGDIINHIAIFVEEKNGEVYFIDCTQKEEDGPYEAVNGVSLRHYPKTDERFKGYGRMKIGYYK